MTTEIVRCSITELVAIDRAARGDRQLALLRGARPWTRRDHPFLERLRDVRGIHVIEENYYDGKTVHVTIYGSLTMDGFRRKL